MANGTAMVASVRSELGVLDDAALLDARIIDYFNEGAALMLPDVTQTLVSTLVFDADDLVTPTPTGFVRVVKIMADPNYTGEHRVPPFVVVDGNFRWVDRVPRPASQALLVYEAAYPAIANSASAIIHPDPMPEALIAFACFRWTQRLVGDRAAYKRYATQTGTNTVEPEDLERLSDMWHQRYLQSRDQLSTRKTIASAQDIVRF